MTIPEELRALFPTLSDEQLIEAQQNLDRYLLLAWEIMEDQSRAEGLIDGRADQL